MSFVFHAHADPDELIALLDRHLPPSKEKTLLKALVAFATQAASIGQCTRDTPPADLHYEQSDDGLFVCCTHDPRHCSKIA